MGSGKGVVVSDPLTEPLCPGQTPYHLRTFAEADPVVEARHLAQLQGMQRRQLVAPTIKELKDKDQQ